MIEKSCTNCALDLVACFSCRVEACEQWRPDNTVKRDVEIKEIYSDAERDFAEAGFVLTEHEKEEINKIVGIDVANDLEMN